MVPPKRNLFAQTTFIALIALVFGTGAPATAQAALFSNIIGYFSDAAPETDNTTPAPRYTSQTVPLLKPSRNIDPTNTGGGDVMIADNSALVAEVGPSGTIADLVEGGKHGTVSTYVVESGDSLSTIAEKFDVSVNTIKWANDIKGNTVRVGQELVILPVTGIRYTVKNSGSIRDIVKKYGGDVDDAARFNDVDADEELAAGTVVIIPDAEIQVAAAPTKKKSSGITYRVNVRIKNAGPAYVGYFVNPLNNLGTRTQGLHGYNGVDIGAPVGTPIIAAAAGTVTVSRSPAYYNGGYGGYVVISHDNGTQTLYAHMSRNVSTVGDRVGQGEVIGYVGTTGKSTGPHLHFEVRGAQNPF
jgi:murein DD-endopeptidase MepM/ murein hydrolase activator NlpD